MKIFLGILCLTVALACNNATKTDEPKQDTTASSSADSILKAVEKMKADSAAMQGDTSGIKKDSMKK